MNWYAEFWKKYTVFSGRARRKEYWIPTIINWVIGGLLNAVLKGLVAATGTYEMAALSQVIILLWIFATLLPSLAITARRLHDTGRSGWWILIALVPCVGAIILFVFECLDSQPGANQYGPNPKETV